MASNTADTVQNILQIVSDLRGESSTNTDASRIRAVSRGEREWAKRKFRIVHLKRNTTGGTGNGSTQDFEIGSATYPMRSKGLSEVFVGGYTEDKRHQVVDYNVFQNLINRNASERVVYQWYDVANDLWKVHINPAPATGDVVYYSYYWEPPKRTLTTESVVCSNMDIIARLTLAYIYESEDEDKFKEQLQLAENLIQADDTVESTPAVNQLYTMGAIENSITSRGLGSY